jgi:acid phosphatase class B
MQLSNEFLEQWNHIISSVDKTDFPVECINKIILRLANRRQRTINILKLRSQGLDYDGIEQVLSAHFELYEEDIENVEFILNIGAVAQLIQPETDRLLKDIQ